MKLPPIAVASSVALAACVAQPGTADPPAPDAAIPQPYASEAAAAEEPLPPHWTGAFTMVETENVPAGREQFRLTLRVGSPNYFRAERGCYTQEGYLRRRGGEWVVQRRGGIQVDDRCLAAPGVFKGSPEGLFQHRAVTLSPPGRRWIAEGDARWTYLPNPAAPPLRPPPPPPPPPRAPPSQAGMPGGGLEAADPDAVEALYRHQIAHNASGGKLNVALLCLAAGPDGDRLADPPETILARFRGHAPPVKGYSGCRWDDVHWEDRATGGEAIVHYVTRFSCPSAVRCTAAGGYLEGNMSASGNRYELERSNGRWRVTSDVMEWIS